MLKVRQNLGKYRIEKRLAEGGFAVVYQAYDTIEGVSVALKVPHKRLVTADILASFRKEARLMARLDHPNILKIKNASFIGKEFVIVYPLGVGTLGDRLERRMTFETALEYADQMIDAVAYAHEHRIIHCDIKPDNWILFPNREIRLTDFGISKLALATRTIFGSGAGTVGYLAPEQALGRPSFRSDVFSLGLVFWKMFTGEVPEWPFEWPLEGYERIRYRLHPDFIAFLRKCLEVNQRKRFENAIQMQAVYQRLRPRIIRHARRRKKRKKVTSWKAIQIDHFQKRYGRVLKTVGTCKRCKRPISETMTFCPWCGSKRRTYDGPTTFPAQCSRCKRGMKKDWRFCPWCYGPGYEPDGRTYSDKRYEGKCTNPRCKRKVLMPYMHYCPWCRTKVRRKWKIPGSNDKCPRCGWGAIKEFWGHCPWCGRRQPRGGR